MLQKALCPQSSLQTLVRDGIGAVKGADHQHFDSSIRADFSDSLDLDAALRSAHPEENRWDYLLGYTPSDEIIAVEPHSAQQGEISTIIKKRSHARQQLKPHLRDGARVSKWLWVASGQVQFADTEKARRQLDQNGISFVGKVVKAKHLPTAKPRK